VVSFLHALRDVFEFLALALFFGQGRKFSLYVLEVFPEGLP
jgi:hypothetical protein